MTYARKVILQLPLSNGAALKPFVEQCLQDEVALVAIVGDDADEIEDRINDILVDDGADPNRFFVTTSHMDEPIEDVLYFAQSYEADQGGEVQQIRL